MIKGVCLCLINNHLYLPFREWGVGEETLKDPDLDLEMEGGFDGTVFLVISSRIIFKELIDDTSSSS